jgi:hypothetical protein
LNIGKAAACGLGGPFGAVIVAVEIDAAVGGQVSATISRTTAETRPHFHLSAKIVCKTWHNAFVSAFARRCFGSRRPCGIQILLPVKSEKARCGSGRIIQL